jgi:hypothetical protein
MTAALPLLLLWAAAACGPGGTAESPDGSGAAAMPTLGPVDGHDLPATDLDRVQVGHVAPDFTLASLAGPPITLSGYRGSKDVVLVFYRGHW